MHRPAQNTVPYHIQYIPYRIYQKNYRNQKDKTFPKLAVKTTCTNSPDMNPRICLQSVLHKYMIRVLPL